MCIVQITAGNRWHTQTEPFEGSWRRGYLWRWGQGTRKPQGTVRDLGASEQNLTTQRPAWTKGMTYDWNADGEGILDEAMTFELDAASLQQPNRENVQESNISTPTLRSFCPFFLFHFFLMWTIFKVFIEFVTLSHLFFFFNVLLFFFPGGMWDLSSQTKDWTHTPCIGRWNLNYWTTQEAPPSALL